MTYPSSIAERAAREIAKKYARKLCLLFNGFDSYDDLSESDIDDITEATAIISRAIEESREPQPTDAYGYCEYSAIHRDTAHFREPGCVNWKPISNSGSLLEGESNV